MINPVNDTTKPSRLKRRQKRRWKIADLITAGLTDCFMAAILTPLSTHLEAGVRSPYTAVIGHYQTWFFYTHQKHNSILLWWDVLSNPLKGWPCYVGTSNLIHPTAQQSTPLEAAILIMTLIT